jgi:toxin HigB-1
MVCAFEIAKNHSNTKSYNALQSQLVAHHATSYHSPMITSFRHKGLRKYFESGSVAGIQPAHANRLKMQLVALDTAQVIEDMDIPGFRLHQLKGSDRGRWSIWVSGNWRVTFEFADGNALILDYEDYH